MPRLSCRFCIFAPKAALVLAGNITSNSYGSMSRSRRRSVHSFREGFKIAEVLEEVEAGKDAGPVSDWKM